MFSGNLKITENGLVSVVERVLKSSNSVFLKVIRPDLLGKSFDFVLFLIQLSCIMCLVLFTCINFFTTKKTFILARYLIYDSPTVGFLQNYTII